MKVTNLAVQLCTAIFCAKTVAAADWSYFYTDPNDKERAVGVTATKRNATDVSPRYDINDPKCLWGEPGRHAFWIPGKVFHQTYCLHMSKDDGCACQSDSIQFDAYKECKAIDGDFKSYWFTEGECGPDYCASAAATTNQEGWQSCPKPKGRITW